MVLMTVETTAMRCAAKVSMTSSVLFLSVVPFINKEINLKHCFAYIAGMPQTDHADVTVSVV